MTDKAKLWIGHSRGTAAPRKREPEERTHFTRPPTPVLRVRVVTLPPTRLTRRPFEMGQKTTVPSRVKRRVWSL